MIRPLPLLAGLLLFAAAATPAHAQWPENGLPVTTAPGSQRLPAMEADGQGGVFVAWQDMDPPRNVFLQRIGADGQSAPGWPAGGISIGTGCIDLAPRICRDDAGGVYVGWCSDGPPAGYYLQRVTGSGAVASGWPAGGQHLPFVLSSFTAAPIRDGAGGAFVHWRRSYTYTDVKGRQRQATEVRLQHILPSGVVASGWPADGVEVDRKTGLEGFAISPDGSGGVSLAYGWWIYVIPGEAFGGNARRLDADRNMLYSSALDCVSGQQPIQLVSYHSDGAGGAIVGFTERTDYPFGPPPQHMLVKLNPSGLLDTGWAPHCQPFFPGRAVAPPDIVADGGTGVFLTWRDTLNSPEADIYALRLDAAGLPAGGWSPSGEAACVAPGNQMAGPMIADGLGGAILAWVDTRAGAGSSAFDIYAQRIGPDGPGVPGWPATGLPVCTAPGAQQALQLVSDGVGGAYVCWEDYRSGSSDIYLYRLGPGGPVPVLVSVASTEVGADRVRITWQLGEPFAGVVKVLKRTPDGDWTPEGPVLPDGTGRIEYEDRAVQAGGRYGYRLAIIHSGETEYAGEVWVDIPTAAFGLGAVSPNPSASGWVVSLTLLDESGAALDLIDVQGRVVTTEQLGPLGAGPHRVTVGGSGSLPAGVYTLRLRHAGLTATVRGAIVR